MVVTALGLLLGGRADSGAVRSGADGQRSRSRAGSTCDLDGAVARRAEEAGAELDDGTLSWSRTVSAEGRSRASVGGAAVPAGYSATLAADLVVVHGQSDQQRLLQPAASARPRRVRRGRAAPSCWRALPRDYDRLQRVAAELDEIVSGAASARRRPTLLRFGLAEVEAVDPKPGEDVDARRRGARGSPTSTACAARPSRRAGRAERRRRRLDAVGRARAWWRRARKSLDAERDHDPRLAELGGRAGRASYALADVAADIAAYAAALDADPARLAAVQERRAVLAGSDPQVRRHGGRRAGLVGRRPRPAAASSRTTTPASRRCGHRAAGARGRAARRGAADRARGAPVGADAGRGGHRGADRRWRCRTRSFAVTVDAAWRDAGCGDGLDEIAFLFSAHAGGDAASPAARRVRRRAVPGDARARGVPGGHSAGPDDGVRRGRCRCRRQGGGRDRPAAGPAGPHRTQVIVVTHLPQVAAFADQHYVVRQERATAA